MAIFDFFKDKTFDDSISDLSSLISTLPDNIRPNALDDSDILQSLSDAANPAEDQEHVDLDEVSNIFKDLEIPQERINRFALYSSIYNNVQICKRVIAVYLSNSFLRNTISNKSYIIKSIEQSDKTKYEIDNVEMEEILTKFNIVNRIKEATKDMLVYGESYVEIVDLDTITVKMPDNVEKNKKPSKLTNIQEARILSDLKNKKPRMVTNYDSMIDLFIEFDDDDVFDEVSDTNVISEGVPKANKTSVLDRVLLRFHHPKKILKLESEFGICLGYVEINQKQVDLNVSGSINTTQQFMQTVNLISGGIHNTTKKKSVTVTTHALANSLVKRIFKNNDIVKKIYGDTKSNHKEYLDMIDSKIQPDLMYSIKKVLMSNSKMHVRYIPPANMVQLKYTNGTSVIDTLVYPAKLYLLIQLTNIVSKMSRSAAVRKWTVNIGSRENGSAVIRKLRDSLRNQRITASDMTSKDISKIMTDFRDLIVVNKDGQSYLDVDITNLGDPSISTQDLEFQRNEMVAVSGIPASYLGYNDSYELRDQLVHANVSFANEILSVQENVNDSVNLIISKIRAVGNSKVARSSVQFTLTPPMVLMLQVIEVVMQSFSTIFGMLKDTMGLDLDPLDMLNHFVPYADWKGIIEKGKAYKMNKSITGANSSSSTGF